MEVLPVLFGAFEKMSWYQAGTLLGQWLKDKLRHIEILVYLSSQQFMNQASLDCKLFRTLLKTLGKFSTR
jgi:hypothetical protein